MYGWKRRASPGGGVACANTQRWNENKVFQHQWKASGWNRGLMREVEGGEVGKLGWVRLGQGFSIGGFWLSLGSSTI